MFSDNSAISTVVAAMLIFGLLITVAAFVNVHHIPSWVKDDEAKHVRSVFTDFSQIPGSINKLALANETDIMSKQRIKLGGGNIPILSPGKSWGSLGAVPREGNFTVWGNAWMVNITQMHPPRDNLAVEGVNITNVSGISRFDIYVQKMNNTDWIDINLTNQGNRSGSAWVNYTDDELTITIRNDWDNKIIDGVRLNKNITWNSYPPGYRIDLLNPCYGFGKVLSDTDIPYNLTITNSTGVEGMYHLWYNNYNLTREDYSITSNGTLMYRSMNRHFLDQKFIYQNGAVFLCQPPDASMRIAPTITIENATNGSSANITIPMVTVGTGVNRTPMVGGSGIEELQMKLDHLNRVPFAEGNNTDKLHIIIESPDGDDDFRRNYLLEWEQYINDTVKRFNKITDRAPVGMEWHPDNSSINITLNGSIHLEIQEITIEGQVTNIAS
jgi:hypothetical protein